MYSEAEWTPSNVSRQSRDMRSDGRMDSSFTDASPSPSNKSYARSASMMSSCDQSPYSGWKLPSPSPLMNPPVIRIDTSRPPPPLPPPPPPPAPPASAWVAPFSPLDRRFSGVDTRSPGNRSFGEFRSPRWSPHSSDPEKQEKRRVFEEELSEQGKRPFYFKGKGHPLSNFFPFKLRIFDCEFGSSEAAYQYCKAVVAQCWDAAEELVNAVSGLKAKSIAYRVPNVPEWDKYKEKAMQVILDAKVEQCEPFRKLLKEQRHAYFIEDTDNTFWARGSDYKGENTLGRLIMEVREKLVNDKISSSETQRNLKDFMNSIQKWPEHRPSARRQSWSYFNTSSNNSNSASTYYSPQARRYSDTESERRRPRESSRHDSYDEEGSRKRKRDYDDESTPPIKSIKKESSEPESRSRRDSQEENRNVSDLRERLSGSVKTERDSDHESSRKSDSKETRRVTDLREKLKIKTERDSDHETSKTVDKPNVDYALKQIKKEVDSDRESSVRKKKGSDTESSRRKESNMLKEVKKELDRDRSEEKERKPLEDLQNRISDIDKEHLDKSARKLKLLRSECMKQEAEEAKQMAKFQCDSRRVSEHKWPSDQPEVRTIRIAANQEVLSEDSSLNSSVTGTTSESSPSPKKTGKKAKKLKRTSSFKRRRSSSETSFSTVSSRTSKSSRRKSRKKKISRKSSKSLSKDKLRKSESPLVASREKEDFDGSLPYKKRKKDKDTTEKKKKERQQSSPESSGESAAGKKVKKKKRREERSLVCDSDLRDIPSIEEESRKKSKRKHSDEELDKSTSSRTSQNVDTKSKSDKNEEGVRKGDKREPGGDGLHVHKKSKKDRSRNGSAKRSVSPESPEQKKIKKVKSGCDIRSPDQDSKTERPCSSSIESETKAKKDSSPKKDEKVISRTVTMSKRHSKTETDSIQDIDAKCEKRLMKVFEDRLRNKDGRSRSRESHESDRKPLTEETIQKNDKASRSRSRSVNMVKRRRDHTRSSSSASPESERSIRLRSTVVKSERDEHSQSNPKKSSRTKDKLEDETSKQQPKSRQQRSCSDSDSSSVEVKRQSPSKDRRIIIKSDQVDDCCACCRCKCHCHGK